MGKINPKLSELINRLESLEADYFEVDNHQAVNFVNNARYQLESLRHLEYIRKEEK
jgi:hypothetical protein